MKCILSADFSSTAPVQKDMIFAIKLLALCGSATAALLLPRRSEFHRTVSFDGTQPIFRQRARFSHIAFPVQSTPGPPYRLPNCTQLCAHPMSQKMMLFILFFMCSCAADCSSQFKRFCYEQSSSHNTSGQRVTMR